MSGNPKLALLRSATGGAASIIIVKVGAEKEEYSIHCALLISHSEYFASALKGPWNEAQEGVVVLDDVRCDEFKVFVNYMYTGKAASGRYNEACRCDTVCTCTGDGTQNLLGALVLAD
ncbi:hypothetical protein NX059_012306 [Plenodomus lindquistii]|nr:hypothetical protein NX059_012306 [Plenodomus lindquistii]